MHSCLHLTMLCAVLSLATFKIFSSCLDYGNLVMICPEQFFFFFFFEFLSF